MIESGFIQEITEHAMICDLNKIDNFKQKTDLVIKCIFNTAALQDFISILELYDPHVLAFYECMNDKLLKSNERFFVGYVDDKPTTIGILFFDGSNAGIFTLITKENLRRNGYGADMMVFLMKTAKNHGYRSVTLSQPQIT